MTKLIKAQEVDLSKLQISWSCTACRTKEVSNFRTTARFGPPFCKNCDLFMSYQNKAAVVEELNE